MCPRCGHDVDRKSSMLIHIDRKNKCNPTMFDIDLELYRERILNREDITIELKLKEEIKILRQENELLKKNNTQGNNITAQNVQNIGRDNITNNTNNTNNITLNITYYNDPNTEYLKNSDYMKCLGAKDLANIELAKLLWMNPKYPENHSLYIPNVSRNNVKVCVSKNGKNKFQLKNSEPCFEEIIETCEYYLNNKCDDDDLSNELSEDELKKFSNLKEKYYNFTEHKETNKKMKKKEKNDLKQAFINYRDIINKTIMKHETN